jgi:hypothetical protein
VQRADPAVAARRDRLDIPRLARFVAEDAAQLGDDAGQGVVGNGGVGPDGFKDLLLGDEFARALDQERQQIERFGFERQGGAVPLEAKVLQIEDEVVPAILS